MGETRPEIEQKYQLDILYLTLNVVKVTLYIRHILLLKLVM